MREPIGHAFGSENLGRKGSAARGVRRAPATRRRAAWTARESARLLPKPNPFPFARPVWLFAAPALSRGYHMFHANFGSAPLVCALRALQAFTFRQAVEAAHVPG
jgi:hypothetical protein